MESSPDKKKKNVVGGWLNRLLPPRAFEFETSLTPQECYERLQKLPGKMVYLKAKSRVELANSGMQKFQLQWKTEENTCEFAQSGQNRQNQTILQGKVFVSEIYESTLVQGRFGIFSDKRFFRRDTLLYVVVAVLAFVIASVASGFPLHSFVTIMFPALLSMLACSSLLIVFLVLVVTFPRARAELKLLQNVLTESDESQL